MRAKLVVAASVALAALSVAQLAFAQAGGAPVLRPLKTEQQWTRECLRANNNDGEVCSLSWGSIAGASVTADAITALVPQRAGDTLTAQSVRARAPMVQWTARPAQGAGATGIVRNEYIQDEVRVSANFDRVMFAHASDPDLPDFFDTNGALALRGATVRMLGCDNRPGVLHMRAESVAAPGRLPFLMVTVSAYGGPSPTGATVVDLSGAPPTLQRATALFGNARWGRCEG